MLLGRFFSPLPNPDFTRLDFCPSLVLPDSSSQPLMDLPKHMLLTLLPAHSLNLDLPSVASYKFSLCYYFLHSYLWTKV